MSGHDQRFDRWDAAYVLGALSVEDRRDYEEHLSECESCRGKVAELGGLPGLLSRVPAGAALQSLAAPHDPTQDVGPIDAEVPAAPVELAERLHRQARRRRRRSVLLPVGAGLVAAALAVIAVLGVQSALRPVSLTSSPTVIAELAPTAAVGKDAELSASVRLYAKAWGTEIDTECRHHAAGGQPGSQPTPDPLDEGYALVLIDASGRATQVSSWAGIEKSPIDTTTATATRIDQMRALEIRSLDGGTVLLTGRVPG